MKTISLKILTAEKIVYQDEVLKVVLPTKAGEIGILPDHAPLVSIISPGEIKLTKKENEFISLSIDGGILEVKASIKEDNLNSEVIILASSSELATEIDISRAEAAYNRAKKAMEEGDKLSSVDFARFEALINKELNRIKIGKKYKKINK